MKVLVLGGTRFFGVHLVRELIAKGYGVTIATRGNTVDSFGDSVDRIIVDHTDFEDMKSKFSNVEYDVVFDDLAYCSNDVRYTLESIKCNRYIMVSSTAVYELHPNTIEEDYLPANKELIWCNRADYSYDEIKRLAEGALVHEYATQNSVAVRIPYVIGKDDYTERLKFYVEHTIKQIPMNIDNIDCQMSFITSDEAGKFLAFLTESDYTGSINGACSGTISIRNILDYVERKTGKKAIIDNSGETAPYNGTCEYGINTNKADNIGYIFSDIEDSIYEMIEYYIKMLLV